MFHPSFPTAPISPGRLSRFISCASLFVAVVAGPATAAGEVIETDICVYGGAAGGVTAAVQAARLGKTVSLVVIDNHLGGLTSSGLGETDVGLNGNDYIQGMSREFYTRVGAKYGQSGAKFAFEPKVAEAVFNEMVAGENVRVYKERYLTSTIVGAGRITQITTQNGDVFRAKMFIDASYEGDLMKQAGVTYVSGREANSKYGETIDGIQTVTTGNQLPNGIDPYVIPGNPSSGLLPGVNPAPSLPNGSADSLIQAFCYRMCLTNVAANRNMILQPEGYNAADYEILFRAIEAGQTTRFWKTTAMPNGKTDSNNDSGVSCDFITGTTGDWIEADHATRAQLAKAHEAWQRGLVWTLQNHPRVPQAIRTTWGQWGLPKDEFTDNGNWPHQLYVREARRMVSDYVMTEKNCMGTEVAADSVGMGAYTMDSHNCQRIVSGGMVKNEGDIQRPVPGPYPISYRSLVPKTGECGNLLVPWGLSASHIAFGSIRMEPVFMNLGQSAATAAAFAIDDNVPVQSVSYPKLKAQMLADGERLTNSDGLSGTEIIVDNTSASGVLLTGTWTSTTSTPGYYGSDYLHDGDVRNGTCSARFTPNLPVATTYQVYLRWTAHTNRASNVPVEIRYPGGIYNVSPAIDERSNGGTWVSLGSFAFNAGSSPTQGSVTLRDTGTNGYVVADAVRFVAASALPVVNLWATNSSAAEPTVNQAAAPATITVSRTSPFTSALVVNISSSGTAIPGTDVSNLPSSITIPAGASSYSFPVTPLADGIAEGPETLVISALAGAAYTLGDLTSGNVIVSDTPFDTWRFTSFSVQQLADPAISGPDADPDHDGASNLLEFFSDGNPLVANAPTEVSLKLSPLRVIETRRNRAADKLFFRLEQSGALDSWSPASATVETLDIAGEPDVQKLRFELPGTPPTTGFFRVAVSLTPFN